MDAFREFLNQHDEPAWDDVLADLDPSLHPVDRESTRIWFGFWPLKLRRLLRESTDEAATAQEYLLDGRYRLEHQLDESVDFLYGSIYWGRVKEALLQRSESASDRNLESLGREIRNLAGGVASQLKVEVSLLLGISAVAFMAFQQVGAQPFRNASGSRNAAFQPARAQEDSQIPIPQNESRALRLSPNRQPQVHGPLRRIQAGRDLLLHRRTGSVLRFRRG